MKRIFKTLGAAMCAALIGAGGTAHAGSYSSAGGSASGPKTTVDIASEDNGAKALLDTLVVKGLLTDQEAEEINEKMTKDLMSSPMIQFSQAAGIKRIMLFGDLRLRFESRDGQQPHGAPVPASGTPGTALTAAGISTTNDTETRDRDRYRLRVGAKFDLTDSWYGGIRFDTGVNNPRSGNVTFGQNSGAVGNNSNGPYGKANAGIGVGQAYLGWKAADFVTFQIGRMPNPLYTTGLVWDANLPMDGVAEMFNQKINNDIEFFGNFVQSIYSDSTLDGSISGATGATTPSFSDIYLFAEQVGLKVKFDPNISGKVAATVYTYSGSQSNTSATTGSDAVVTTNANGSQPTGFNGPFNGDMSDGSFYGGAIGNNYGVNNLNVIEVPGEIDFTVPEWKNTPFRVYENFAINTEATERADLATHHGKGLADGYAYQAGIQVGSAKKKGQWESSFWWQHTGTYSVDPNLVDADIFDGRTNMQGLVLSGTYNFTDAISGTVRVAEADRIDHSVGTDGLEMGTPGTAQDLNLAAIDHYKLLQIDLNWKF